MTEPRAGLTRPFIAPPPGMPFRVPPPAPPAASPTRRAASAGPRTRFRLEGPDRGGWHANWYVLCKSDDLRVGTLTPSFLFGGRLLATRLPDGSPKVVTGICRHVGADMAQGGILRNGEVICPFHHWRYDVSTGRATANGFGQAAPKGVGLFAFPVAERWGLVWVFNGPEPAYDVPGFHDLPRDHAIDPNIMQLSMPLVQEVWVPFSNSNDFTHLRFLHRVTQLEGPDQYFIDPHRGTGHHIRFRMPAGKTYDLQVRTHGTNCIAFSITIDGSRERFYNLFTATPTDEGAVVTTMITGAPRDLPPDRVRALTAEARDFGITLSAEDTPVIDNAWFGPDNLMDVDHELAAYFDFVEAWPRFDPFAPCRGR